MRALIQRVLNASVSIEGSVYSAIGNGFVVFLGVKDSDTPEDAVYLSGKCADLRIFEDESGKMNRSLNDIGGEMLVISQFTLHADTRRGNRPSFTKAAQPEIAERLYHQFIESVRERLGHDRVRTGSFRAMMDVELVNNGPVTIMLGSKSEYDIG